MLFMITMLDFDESLVMADLWLSRYLSIIYDHRLESIPDRVSIVPFRVNIVSSGDELGLVI